MHLRAKRPVFVPAQHFNEMDAISKAMWMDIAWDLAKQMAGGDEAADQDTWKVLVERCHIVHAARALT